MTVERDMLSPREVADRVGLSYHAVLRAIKRGDVEAVELVSGRLRVRAAEYERWCREGVRKQRQAAPVVRRLPGRGRRDAQGFAAELKAVEETAA